ncbi:aminotransferase class III-fold pyridoxal phosphate-dependent enzyme [uncultured Roseovarius sp.]|uniref:aspartate aminotransferase family protein n=1 Tax=uncultured Roseovarius sp. TaxID=293344 RepID=UPI002596F5AA|nr:aminotransferase class III-fold pyridoxal phosphate-dependent enzyme [uncultured Roseovarius sp.]
MTDTAEDRLSELRAAYAARRPESRHHHERARAVMPGGNTRSVLHLSPFPFVIAGGKADTLTDIDGISYIDCAGEFSAGLYGHDTPEITAALHEALAGGLVLSGPNRYEVPFAELICARFASVERVRFCNSGTEANLFAIQTARNATGRDRIMVFEGAYHGGVLTFGQGPSPMAAPFDWVMARFNEIDATRAAIRDHAGELAAILVEPMIGAAGNIPARAAFLDMLRQEASRAGAILIFDEVKTSRLGAGGLQGEYGVTPDMTTLGKYLGGGLPFGAFGGRAEVMERFDPARPGALAHAGTFNNNVMSMAGGLAGLRDVFTPARAAQFLQECEAFRHGLNAGFAKAGLEVRASGMGSILSLHLGAESPETLAQSDPRSVILRQLVHLNALERGLALTPRGDIYLSLPMDAPRRERIAETLTGAVRDELPFVPGRECR